MNLYIDSHVDFSFEQVSMCARTMPEGLDRTFVTRKLYKCLTVVKTGHVSPPNVYVT